MIFIVLMNHDEESCIDPLAYLSKIKEGRNFLEVFGLAMILCGVLAVV